MQQRRRRLFAHSGIAVGGAGDDTLEQAEYAAHTLDPVEGGDKMHLRGAWIGKAHIDAAPHQAAQQARRPALPQVGRSLAISGGRVEHHPFGLVMITARCVAFTSPCAGIISGGAVSYWISEWFPDRMTAFDACTR